MAVNPPCGKVCPRRSVGCATTCADWAVYVEKRNAAYEEKRTQKEYDFNVRYGAIMREVRRRKKEQNR